MIVEALMCLALNVYHEARGETFEGKQAVALVTLNRVNDARFPSSVCNVVKQGARNGKRRACQFSWYCDGRRDKPRDATAYAEALHIAHDAITGAFEDFTDNALWYHHKKARPVWRTRLTGARTIGNHVFYNVRKKNTRF